MVLSLFKEFHFSKFFFPDAFFIRKFSGTVLKNIVLKFFYGSYSDETSITDGTICLHLSIWPCYFGKLKKTQKIQLQNF